MGSFAANPWGLHDTASNVWEWTCSVYDKTYAGKEKTCAGDGHRRVTRGTSWSGDPAWMRSADRGWNTTPSRSEGGGFRLAQDL